MHVFSFSKSSKIPVPSRICRRLLCSSQSIPISSLTSVSSSSASPVPTHEQISHLILEQKSASEALKTFKWASTLPNYIHSQSTYRALVHKLCTFRRFDNVKELLDEMPESIGLPPDQDIFITIIRGFGRARRIKEVINVLDLVSKFGERPTLKIFNTILDILVKEDIDLAKKFYKKKMMKSGVQGDDYTFGILMKGLCLTNRIGEGFKLLQVIKSGGIMPNTVVYNTLLHALCKNGKVGRARSLMNEMQEPNDVTFNILISAYCKEENLVQSLVMLEKAFKLGFVPGIVAVTKLLELLCAVGRITEAVEVLERVESKGGVVDVVGHNTLLKGFCRIGKVKVGCRLMKEMELKGCLPNVDTYNILISGFFEVGMLDSALDLFNAMKTDGISSNFTTYDTMIKGLCSGGRTEDGFKILELMEESKCGPGKRISPYNNVLHGLYRESCMNEAIDFLIKMGKLFPRAVDRSMTILGYCKEGKTEDARRVFNQMKNEGGSPGVLVYDCLISGFCQEGYVREAFELINDMIGSGYFPVASTFNALISGFCKQGNSASALKLMDDMVGRGCILDCGSFIPLIETLCKRDFQTALELVHHMLERGICPDYLTWNSLLFYLSQETAWSESNNADYVNTLLQEVIET